MNPAAKAWSVEVATSNRYTSRRRRNGRVGDLDGPRDGPVGLVHVTGPVGQHDSVTLDPRHERIAQPLEVMDGLELGDERVEHRRVGSEPPRTRRRRPSSSSGQSRGRAGRCEPERAGP